MGRNVLALLILLSLSFASIAQVIDGYPGSTSVIRFTNDSIPNFLPDTAVTPLWQLGHSRKSFFGIDSVGTTTIMTDTLNPYPVNANNWFVIKVPPWSNTIIDFWHRYQADSGKDGGIVEFSLDHGITWQNVKGDCNVDSSMSFPGVLTTNFYTFNDTLVTGQPAFTGYKNVSQYSRFQFFEGFPIGPPSAACDWGGGIDTFYIRFRFVSDSIVDTMAGWMIDSIKIENDNYGAGFVSTVKKQQSLATYPNPSFDGLFNFPALTNEQDYNTEVYNAIGEKLFTVPYAREMRLDQYPKGLYFYRVTDGTNYYSGRLLME